MALTRPCGRIPVSEAWPDALLLACDLRTGLKNSFAAISNPFSLSWWFTARRHELLAELELEVASHTDTVTTMPTAATSHGHANHSGGTVEASSHLTDDEGRAGLVDLEAGRGLSEFGMGMDRGQRLEEAVLRQEDDVFSRPALHPMDVYAKRLALAELSSDPALMPSEPHLVNKFSDVTAHLLAPFVSSFDPATVSERQLHRCRELYALQPWWELNGILIITAVASNVWTFRPNAFSIVPLLLLYPLDLALILRPRSLTLFLLYALAVALVIVSLSIDRDVFPVAMLRTVLMMGPALFLPVLQSAVIAAEVFTFTRANRLIYWARTGANRWFLEVRCHFSSAPPY